MSFPVIINGSCSSCSQPVATCSCQHDRTPQSSFPIQAPGPSTPHNPHSHVPAHTWSTDEVLWAGADIPALGITNGEKLTTVLSKIIAAL